MRMGKVLRKDFGIVYLMVKDAAFGLPSTASNENAPLEQAQTPSNGYHQARRKETGIRQERLKTYQPRSRSFMGISYISTSCTRPSGTWSTAPNRRHRHDAASEHMHVSALPFSDSHKSWYRWNIWCFRCSTMVALVEKARRLEGGYAKSGVSALP